MDTMNPKSIRNICLTGHSGSGKTSLAEAMLYLSKATERLGNIADGNTVSDFDEEEIKRGISISTSVLPITWLDKKINILDTPGYIDFNAEVSEAMRVADSMLIVVDGRAGVQVGTELQWKAASRAGIPRAFFINRFDDNEARFKRVFDSLREHFGVAVCPLLIPMIEKDQVTGFLNLIDMKAFTYHSADGSHDESEIPEEFKEVADTYHNMLLESIAETSDELMEKFFADEPITYDVAFMAIHKGIITGSIVPVFCGSATKLWGIKMLMDTISTSFPRYRAKEVETVMDGEEEKKQIITVDGHTDLFVFKTVSDPFVGKMSFFKVMNGEIKKDTTLYHLPSGEQEKIARLYTMCGKKQTEVDALCCGDIGMTPKLVHAETNDTLASDPLCLPYKPIQFSESFYQKAVVPATKGDEDKISAGITKLLEEDKTLKYENNAETKQMLLSGQGDTHLDVVVARLKKRFSTSVLLQTPKISYREAIKSTVEQQGRHKKQSGGSGQFGDVFIRFSPGDHGLEFTQSVVGGSVPKNFFPAVEKGLQEAMQQGVLIGCPMIGLKADLYDGSYHPVDSNEISFKLAAKIAYKEGLPKANPVILEPVGTLKVWAPDAMLGDVMGDISKRRGRVLGMEPIGSTGEQLIEGEVPMAEMLDYTIALRAMTQGRARFTFHFVRYEELPAELAAKMIEQHKAEQS